MSKNVVLWDGRVVTVDDETADATVRNGVGAHQETPVEAGDAQHAIDHAAEHANQGGFGWGDVAKMASPSGLFDILNGKTAIQAIAGSESADQYTEGIRDTLSFGAAGKLEDAFANDDEGVVQNRHAREAHGTTRFLGETAGLIADPLGALGEGGKIAQGLGKIGVESKYAVRAVEGAIVGVDGYMAGTNVTGDPITVEGLVHAAGSGVLFNQAFGVGGDALGALGSRAKALLAADGEIEAASNIANSPVGKKLVDPDSVPNWEPFRESHASAQSEVATANAKAGQMETAYNGLANDPAAVSDAINATEKARASVLEDIGKSPFVKAQEAMSNADRKAMNDYVGAAAKYQKLMDSTEWFPSKIKATEQAIDSIARRYNVDLGEGTPMPEGDIPGPTPPGIQGPRPQSAAQTRSDKMRGLKEQSSQIRRMWGGGWRAESDVAGARWVKDPSVPADKPGAMKLWADLRDRIAGKGDYVGQGFPSVKIPDLPSPPEIPRGAAQAIVDAGGEHARLTQAASDLRESLTRARMAQKAGGGEAVIEELRSAQQAAKSAGVDAKFPKLPERAPPQMPELPPHMRTLPKTLEGFARMDTKTIGTIAERLDPRSVPHLEALLKDLDMKPGASPAETLASTHAELKKILAASDKVKGEAAQAAQPGGILKNLKKFGKEATASAAGAIGAGVGFGAGGPVGAAVGGVGARFVVRRVLNKLAPDAEATVINASLFTSRESIRAKVRQLMADHLDGSVMRKLGPVTAVLHTSWPSGAPDQQKSDKDAAKARAYEIAAVNAHAPDTVFGNVQHLMGHPSDVAGKVHDFGTRASAYLNYVAPKDPGIDHIGLGQSGWTPSHEETSILGYQLEAVKTPLVSIERILQGDGHPAAVATLWNVWPATMNEVAQELMLNPPEMTYEQGGNYSMLLRGTPVTSLQEAPVVAALQSLYLPNQGPGGGATSGGSPSKPNPGGRPAAISSPVAGSSVSALTA